MEHTRRLKVATRLSKIKVTRQPASHVQDHCASSRMTLLIPCPEYLDKPNSYNFGNIPGELKVGCADFRKAVTKLCEAHRMVLGEMESLQPILDKLKQYNIWNKTPDKISPSPEIVGTPRHFATECSTLGAHTMNDHLQYSAIPHYPNSTLSLIGDICSRGIKYHRDRLAITANTAKFSKRLRASQDSNLDNSDHYSLSVALLMLCLINGEILDNSVGLSTQQIMTYTLREYLERIQFRFHAPTNEYQLSFIDRCRFRSPVITPHGLVTKGWLYELLPYDRDFTPHWQNSETSEAMKTRKGRSLLRMQC